MRNRIKIVQKENQCAHCGGAKIIDLAYDANGYGVSSDIDHSDLCVTRQCEHGVFGSGRFARDCAPCEAEIHNALHDASEEDSDA